MKTSMEENYKLLKERLNDTFRLTDLDDINKKLSSINSPTLVSGVGGSYPISIFLAKVLRKKNNTLTTSITPRDILYINPNFYNNIIVCSHTGKNYGVKTCFDNNLNKYLLSTITPSEDIIGLKYSYGEPLENSFISLAATLLPISIILNYYRGYIPSIEETHYDVPFNLDVYEIMSGYDTSVAASYLESAMTESGMAIPLIHDKYDFCHGRSNIGYKNDHGLIFFSRNKELDNLLIEQLKPYYKEIIILSNNIEDDILADYDFFIKVIYLIHDMAIAKKIDLSNIDYSPVVKKVYYFKGEM